MRKCFFAPHPFLLRMGKMSERSKLQKQFEKACKQIILLNDRISFTIRRYKRARKAGRRDFATIIKFQLDTLESVRDMFYTYAKRKYAAASRADDEERVFHSATATETSTAPRNRLPTA